VTEEGVVVVRTSTDPDVVEALHVHAAEISDMADRGMQAVHDAMAQRADH
jgi:phosphoenolpyruvate synthase/pyruvate phosphate dikinase